MDPIETAQDIILATALHFHEHGLDDIQADIGMIDMFKIQYKLLQRMYPIVGDLPLDTLKDAFSSNNIQQVVAFKPESDTLEVLISWPELMTKRITLRERYGNQFQQLQSIAEDLYYFYTQQC
ncbi:hypothetical protein HY641_05200 [Candidatus Woesearchaeota archaeon]|nr:hypothetical protein [Candidatus Woesearchaeota archaeon]